MTRANLATIVLLALAVWVLLGFIVWLVPPIARGLFGVAA